MADKTHSTGSLFARWSERKRAVAEEDATSFIETGAEEHAASEPHDAAVAQAEETDEELLERLGLPDPDTLDKGDDFSAFMGPAIPARIRNRALRKLWLTNPILANLDELVDYGEDFTDAAMVIDNLQTAYQVGRGFMSDEYDTEEMDDETVEAGEDAPDQTSETADSDVMAEAPSDEPPTPQSEELPDIITAKDTNGAVSSAPPSTRVESGPGTIPDIPEDAEPIAFDEKLAENTPKHRPRMRFRFDEA